jgi:superfamily II DNA or RNA helicase
MLKANVKWPESRRFRSHSEWEPIGFFSEGLCNATTFDLKLGFFSSSAINVLCDGFACFLYHGGRMRLIINDILSEQDKESISAGMSKQALPAFNLADIESLTHTLSERDRHFFECLAWLIRNERIEIKIITPRDGNGIAHTKCGIFGDGINKVAFDGSCNFSRTALIDNCESITAFCDWDGGKDIYKINDIEDDFNWTFQEKDTSVQYVNPEQIRTRITNIFEEKELSVLLEDEVRIISHHAENTMPRTIKGYLSRAKAKVTEVINQIKETENKATKTLNEPHFPYPSGPREYQKIAFENWKKAQRGLFAMATGTGKTLTSLNCLLEIYKSLGYYKAIILVPTLTLVDQWMEECKKFNFANIYKVSSKNPNWKNDIETLLLKEDFNPSGTPLSYIIISTYASYARENIFNSLNKFPKRTLLIADEAHNMGAGRILDRLDGIRFQRRIGLSATPERQYDEVGNRRLNDFFGISERYTFEYSMKEAIDNGFLCRYYYYPHLVELTDEEMVEYTEISKKLAKMFNIENDTFSGDDDILKAMLLKRKRIIHKAANKDKTFRSIVEQRYREKGNLKYTLVYVPEGNRTDDQEDIFIQKDYLEPDEVTERLIDRYTQIVSEVSPTTTVKKFTSDTKERNKILDNFASGELEVLTSMKCLDEGVDVPRSEMAIFCASTGNPRQFIQRRGRILRTHKDKHNAIIHDLVVAPVVSSASENYVLEQRLLSNELKRVRDFASLSENADFALTELEDILSYYNLSIF